MTTALLLVDLQNDFLPGGRLAVPDADEVLPVAHKLMAVFPLVFATQDYHPADHLSFADNHPGRAAGERIDLDGLEQRLWPTHCVQGTEGAQLAQSLDQSRISRIIPKGTNPRVDSYSGFFDNGGRNATGLADALRAAGVTQLVILGLATDYCVKHTALDARRLGFLTLVVEDGCRAVAPQTGKDALDEMERAGVQLVSSELLAMPREVLLESNFLRMVRRGHWEFVERTHPAGAVVIVALTDEGEVLLTDQWRIPVGRRVIEFPAGIVGDEPGLAHERLVDAARRELLEETGYEADQWLEAFQGVSSAGLSNECTTFFLARGLRRVAAGGGDDRENIRVHAIPRDQLDEWLARRVEAGYFIDARLYTGLYLWRQRFQDTASQQPSTIIADRPA